MQVFQAAIWNIWQVTWQGTRISALNQIPRSWINMPCTWIQALARTLIHYTLGHWWLSFCQHNHSCVGYVYTNPDTFENTSFSLSFGLVSRPRQRFCPVKVELFEDALPSGYIKKCHFHIVVWAVKSDVFENYDAPISVSIPVLCLCAIHFSTVAVTLYSLHITVLQWLQKMYLKLLSCTKTWGQVCFRPHI